MPRAIWRGAISFGLVAIPIKLYAATQSRDIPFVMLHGSCHSRVRQKRYCPYHEEEVPYADITKGFEYAKDQYVVMEPADFSDLPVPSKHTIEITRFVELPDIDPIYYQRGYVLEPEPVGQKPFALLRRALTASGRAAIAKVSLRQKEHLVCLRPYGRGIAMSTMFYPDEIRDTDELELPDEDALVTDQEVAMANLLIDQMAGPFQPDEYRDDYRAALERVIEGKLGAAEPMVAVDEPPKARVMDLMEALKASIESAQSQESSVSPVEVGR